jgi:Ohr subfamily peroxiredoxin
MQLLYTAEATATGGRKNGHARSSDGAIDVQINPPKEVGGSGEGTNPEQLFAAGFAACFHSAMRFCLKPLGLSPEALEGSSVTAQVHFLRGEPGDFGLAVDLTGHLPQLDEEQARALMERTHTVCPYSRATRGNVEVGLHVAPAS